MRRQAAATSAAVVDNPLAGLTEFEHIPSEMKENVVYEWPGARICV